MSELMSSYKQEMTSHMQLTENAMYSVFNEQVQVELVSVDVVVCLSL